MIKDPVNSVINWNYFCMNFNSNFVFECWKDQPHTHLHLEQKFVECYKQRGTGCIPFFFCELSRNNQIRFNYEKNSEIYRQEKSFTKS